MATPDFSETFLLYPRRLALERLPVGLPVGWTLECSWALVDLLVELLYEPDESLKGLTLCEGLAEKREIPEDLKNNLLKYTPALRNPLFKLDRGATWLESWLSGSLPPSEPLDVKACCSQVEANCSQVESKSNRSLLFSVLCRVRVRCMITTGPKYIFANVTPPAPNAFDIQPNVVRLLGSSHAPAVVLLKKCGDKCCQ